MTSKLPDALKRQIDSVKDKIKIEDVIAETEPLAGQGKRMMWGARHDSLKVRADEQYYWWYAHADAKENHSGDVYKWLTNERGMAFREAVDHCAHRVGMVVDWNAGQDPEAQKRFASAQAREDAFSVAARVFARRLWRDENKAALDYVRSRGWGDDNIKDADADGNMGLRAIGYGGNNKAAEVDELIKSFEQNGIATDSPAAVSILGLRGDVAAWCKSNGVQPEMKWLDENKIPPMFRNMMIYPHVYRGRVTYLSGRIADGTPKPELEAQGIIPHWNPKKGLVGDKQIYINKHYTRKSEWVALVEGQADAKTMELWGLATIGLCGNTGDDGLKELLSDNKNIVVALDFEMKMWRNALAIAESLGPKKRLFKGIPA